MKTGRPRRTGPRDGDYIPNSNGCWDWQLHRNNNGYGMVCLHYKTQSAHRMYYKYYIGPIPEGLVIDHLCRNTGCVNPAHMEPVTVQENTIRGEGPKRSKKTHCKLGHVLDGLQRNRQYVTKYCKQCKRDRRKQREQS